MIAKKVYLKMKIKKILSMLMFNLSVIYASNHVSNCPDEAFIVLGEKYPSVGSISFNNDPHHGSGTLIDIQNSPGLENFAHLEGRVVLTAAHLFEDFPDPNALPDTYFSVKAGESIQASVHPHSVYIDSNTQYQVGFSSRDIAILILKDPVTNVKGAIVDIISPYDTLMDKVYASVGFGSTGHILSPYSISDDRKRGSFAYADGLHNMAPKSEFCTIKDDVGNDKRIPSGHTPGSLLDLQCYVDGIFLSTESTLKTYTTPSGIARGGDSGGGVFDDATGNLVAIISYGSSDRVEKTHFIEAPYFEHHKKWFENCIQKAQEEYKGMVAEAQATLTENDFVSFMQDNPRPEIPKPLEKSMFDTLMNDRSSLEQILNSGQSVDSSNVVISFHKDWIFDTLSTVS